MIVFPDLHIVVQAGEGTNKTGKIQSSGEGIFLLLHGLGPGCWSGGTGAGFTFGLWVQVMTPKSAFAAFILKATRL